jgi:hypothetical protein
MKKELSYWTAIVHRVSGIALVLFLPLHFWALSRALELDAFLAWTRDPLVRLAEWGIVVALAAHLAGGLRILAQSGARNLFADPFRQRSGAPGWGSPSGMPVVLDDGPRSVRVSAAAAGAGETISLAARQRFACGPQSRLMAAADLIAGGVAADPVLTVVFYDAGDAAIAGAEIDLDEDLGGDRIGGFVEPVAIPAAAAAFELHATAASTGAGAMSLTLAAEFAAFAGPAQTEIPATADAPDEAISRIYEVAAATSRQAAREQGLAYEVGGALSRVLNLETVSEGFAQRINLVETQINAPGTGILSRVSTTETATAEQASRIGVVEQAIEAPSTGILARLTSAEMALIDLDAGKASVTDLTLLELEVDALGGDLSAAEFEIAQLQVGEHDPPPGADRDPQDRCPAPRDATRWHHPLRTTKG